MGFRFRRSINIAPGLRLNASKSGLSASVGRRGAWLTFGPRGTRSTVGIPGTGISYTESSPRRRAGSIAGLVVVLALSVVALAYCTQAHAGCPGCCSSHGGITSSCAADGRVYCADGSVSPTCLCSTCGVNSPPPPPTCTLGRVWNGFACVCPTGQIFGANGCYTPGTTVTVTAIEYHHADFDHYFITANADEIFKLDTGAFQGWTRTGQQFNVPADMTGGRAAVCRFFSTSFAPKSSHFYTPDVNECATVRVNPNWQFEGIVFGAILPDVLGNCPAGTQPIYRLYNDGQGGAPNHRYTVSAAIRMAMIGVGWISEGYGPMGVIMCSPQ